MGVAESVAGFLLFREYLLSIIITSHHRVSRGVHACLLWLSHVAKQSPANSAELWLSASPGPFQELSTLKAERENCKASGSVPLAGQTQGLGLMCQNRMGFSKWHANAKEGVICVMSS